MALFDLKASGESPALPQSPPQKNPGTAFLLSLVVPGFGQFYCGKRRRGLWTLAFFALSLAIVVWLGSQSDSSSNRGLEVLLGTALRACLVLYAFAFVDAYFTAREITVGTDPHLAYNPRVATVLNLLTRGFGYWYLDQKKKGVLLFIFVGLASRLSLHTKSEPLSNWLGLFVEVALGAMAFDAFRIANSENQKYLSKSPLGPLPVQPSSGFSPGIPVALACLLGVSYIGLVVLGMLTPDYTTLDQSQASITEGDDGKSYANRKYGVEVHIPSSWEFDRSDKTYFVEAKFLGGACQVGLLAEAQFPFSSTEAMGTRLVEQIIAQNENFRVVERKPGVLASFPAHEVVFSADVEGTEVMQHYLLARRHLSLYVLVITLSRPFADLCQKDIQSIRERVVVAK